METQPLYHLDPTRREHDAQVIGSGTDDGRPYALLAATLFYPEGGGQPCDTGTLGPARVEAVVAVGGEIRHYLDRPVETGPAPARLDWERRFDHMQQHTGQHLLTAVGEDRFGWATTAFHLGPETCDVELAVPSLTGGQLAALEEAVAEEVRAARPVTARLVTAGEFRTLPVRTRGLPEGHEGDIRLVGIEGLDLNTCGGTHLAHTGEIGSLALLGTERLRGGSRVAFVAGDRVRRRLRRAEERFAGLRGALGVADAELVAAATERMAQVKEDGRRLRRLAAELADHEARRLAGLAEVVVGGHYPERDAGYLQTVGGALVRSAPAKVALLVAGTGEGGAFLLLAGEEGPEELGGVGRIVAGILAGKGGGKGRRFQGKTGSPERWAEALAALRGELA